MTTEFIPDNRDTPKVLGRFNYLSTKKDIYDIIFVPYSSENNIITVIAKNLPRQEMEELMYELNAQLNETTYNMRELVEYPEPDYKLNDIE